MLVFLFCHWLTTLPSSVRAPRAADIRALAARAGMIAHVLA